MKTLNGVKTFDSFYLEMNPGFPDKVDAGFPAGSFIPLAEEESESWTQPVPQNQSKANGSDYSPADSFTARWENPPSDKFMLEMWWFPAAYFHSLQGNSLI